MFTTLTTAADAADSAKPDLKPQSETVAAEMRMLEEGQLSGSMLRWVRGEVSCPSGLCLCATTVSHGQICLIVTRQRGITVAKVFALGFSLVGVRICMRDDMLLEWSDATID